MPEVYENLQSKNPTHKNIGVLIHEKTHYKRMKSQGLIGFGIRYLFSRKGRFTEELVAYTEQMKYLKKAGETFDREKCAKLLSGWIYLWSASYADAKTALDDAWSNA